MKVLKKDCSADVADVDVTLDVAVPVDAVSVVPPRSEISLLKSETRGDMVLGVLRLLNVWMSALSSEMMPYWPYAAMPPAAPDVVGPTTGVVVAGVAVSGAVVVVAGAAVTGVPLVVTGAGVGTLDSVAGRSEWCWPSPWWRPPVWRSAWDKSCRNACKSWDSELFGVGVATVVAGVLGVDVVAVPAPAAAPAG